MPSYSFKNNSTGEEFDRQMSIKERDEFLSKNPDITQLLSRNVGLGDSYRMGFAKKDSNFKEVLGQIKKGHRGSSINTD